MRVGILGSGLMGGKLGTIFARAGHEVVFSYARSNDKLKRLARDAQGNVRAGTSGEAAKEADALLLVVHWSRIDDVLKDRRSVRQGDRNLLSPDGCGQHETHHWHHYIGSRRTRKESSTRPCSSDFQHCSQ